MKTNILVSAHRSVFCLPPRAAGSCLLFPTFSKTSLISSDSTHLEKISIDEKRKKVLRCPEPKNQTPEIDKLSLEEQ